MQWVFAWTGSRLAVRSEWDVRFFSSVCQTPVGEGSYILYCTCSLKLAGAFFSHLNRVTTTSSCHLLLCSLVSFLALFPPAFFPSHWCQRFHRAGAPLSLSLSNSLCVFKCLIFNAQTSETLYSEPKKKKKKGNGTSDWWEVSPYLKYPKEHFCLSLRDVIEFNNEKNACKHQTNVWLKMFQTKDLHHVPRSILNPKTFVCLVPPYWAFDRLERVDCICGKCLIYCVYILYEDQTGGQSTLRCFTHWYQDISNIPCREQQKYVFYTVFWLSVYFRSFSQVSVFLSCQSVSEGSSNEAPSLLLEELGGKSSLWTQKAAQSNQNGKNGSGA